MRRLAAIFFSIFSLLLAFFSVVALIHSHGTPTVSYTKILDSPFTPFQFCQKSTILRFPNRTQRSTTPNKCFWENKILFSILLMKVWQVWSITHLVNYCLCTILSIQWYASLTCRKLYHYLRLLDITSFSCWWKKKNHEIITQQVCRYGRL